MPLQQDIFSTTSRDTLPAWQKILDLRNRLITEDREPPILQSNFSNGTIRGHIYGNDVWTVTLWIYASLPQGNEVFTEELNPSSFINHDGSFQYNWKNQILSLS